MRKVAIFIGNAQDIFDAKTGNGFFKWRPHECVAEIVGPSCQISLGLPRMSPREARDAGATILMIGTTTHGGVISDEEATVIASAVDEGFTIISGMHTKLNEISTITSQSNYRADLVTELRTSGERIVATGEPRSGRRILTVGTDCCVGKMFVALSLTRALQELGKKATFRATGQTGVMIAGSGICIDSIISDFVAGNTEKLTPDADQNHFDVIEGQGSLFHPAYAGPAISLLHGSQPDVLIMCHEWGREYMDGTKSAVVPSLVEAISLNLSCARITNPNVKLGGIAINTMNFTSSEALEICNQVEYDFSIPCVDIVRHGPGRIIERIIS